VVRKNNANEGCRVSAGPAFATVAIFDATAKEGIVPLVTRRPRKRSAKRGPATAVVSKTLRRSGGRSYQAHRDWLLAQHGSVCAYCGRTTDPDTITLDHVRPRRGQTAYDRPDNLVLACRDCNAAKADMPFLAFLLARRSRGVFLLHYGDHLSEGIRDLVRQTVERPLLPPD
jgi:5-methylcytosine-specific restriction endonuclease McrA